MDLKICRYTLIWKKNRKPFSTESWNGDLDFRVAYLFLCTLSSVLNFFSLFCSYFSLYADQMDSVARFFPLGCVWPKSYDPELQQTPNLWKYLCCWWVLSGGKKKKTMWYWVFQHRQLGRHIQEGRGLSSRKHLEPILTYSCSKQQRG